MGRDSMSGHEISALNPIFWEVELELMARGVDKPRKLLDHYYDTLRIPGQRHEISRRVGELLPPAAAPPLHNPSLADYTLNELKQKYLLEFEKILEEAIRGIWYLDDRCDYYEIEDEQARRNALSVPLVCMKDGLVDRGSGFRELRVTPYSKMYDLNREEKFYKQPVISGICSSGVLVAEDVVLLAGHFLNFRSVKALRFVFGFVMIDPVTALTTIPNEKIYSGAEIIQKRCDICGPSPSGSDWALVRLDRPVLDQKIAALSTKPVYNEQSLYTLGYPCGLPLKHAAGFIVSDVQKAYFMAEVSSFEHCSGSPVFTGDTHQLVGIITQGDIQDFRPIKGGNVSVVYPNEWVESEGVRCTRVGEFREFLTGEEKVSERGFGI